MNKRELELKNSAGERMLRIENKADMLIWATYINNNIGHLATGERCDLQDIWGHSGVNTVNSAFCESSERKLIICSVSNVMSFQEVENLLSALANYKIAAERKELYDDIDKREAALNIREQAFKESMKPYHKRLNALRRRNEFLETTNSSLMSQQAALVEDRRSWQREATKLQAKADKYDNIRALLT